MKFKAPYYLVTSVSQLKPESTGYKEMSESMLKLSSEEDGFLGLESARDQEGKGITLSYWRDLESIQNWKNRPEHKKAQKLGKTKWYQFFSVEISKVDNFFE